MRLLVIAMLFIVAGCGSYTKDYQPKLVEPVKDSAKYEADRQHCFVEVDERMEASLKAHKAGVDAAGLLGIVGVIAYSSGVSPDDDFRRAPSEIFDDCMSKRGYKIQSPK